MKRTNNRKISRQSYGKAFALTRRKFMEGAAAVAAFTVVPRSVLGGPGYIPPSEKLNIAAIGAGGQGAKDIDNVSSQNIVALCDVDEERARDTFNKFPNTKKYRDYRKMLDKENKNIDAVIIATPDHTHAPASIMAMRLGKHVYVEKPMAHTIFEARQMTKVAQEMKVVTQMGIQGHASEGLRLTYEFIKDGAIGTVREVHVWSNRPIWPQAIVRPKDTPPVPPTLDWNLWLGPAPWRPYHPCYVPFKWRGWWDFGCGALGDMAIHNADPAFFSLGLDAPYAVEAETGPVNNETFPNWEIITYYFPATRLGVASHSPKGNRPEVHPVRNDTEGRSPSHSRQFSNGVKMIWYDGGKMPPRPPELEEERNLGDNGIIFVGDKGKMFGGGWAEAPRIIPESKMKEYKRPDETLPRSPGHHQEWLLACKENNPKKAMAGFKYSGPFTEAILVGNLAVRLGSRIEWDAEKMRATNAPEADKYINKEYRKGWTL